MFLQVSTLECVYLEVIAALHALHGSSTIMPAIKQVHMAMIEAVTPLIRDTLLSTPATQSLLYNKWVRLLVFIVRQSQDKEVHAAARLALAPIDGGVSVIDSFATRLANDSIYERVGDWHFVCIGCSSGIPRR